MTSFDLWPFDDVRSVERRGDLEVLQGTSPDGVPVTITRIAPDVARDSTLRERFRLAVDGATRQAGRDDPPVLWADTATLVPWAATYDDEYRRGADLIGAIYQSGAAVAGGQAPPSVPPQQQPSNERSVPALEGYQPPVTYHTGQQGYGQQPGYGQQQGYGPQQPVPVPGGQQAPPRKSRTSKLLAFGAGGLVLVLLLGVAISIGLTREPSASGLPSSESPEPVPTESVQFSPGPSTSSASASPTKTPPKPKLKAVKSVSVYGPVWKQGEKTFTMAFHQLGWAYRAPGDFDCLVFEHTETRTRITCTKILDKKPDDNRRLIILDRECSGKTCSAAEQKTCGTDKDGYKPPLKRKDSTTQYNTTTFKDKKTKDKTFAEFMLHYYKGPSGDRNNCVLVYTEGKLGTYATDMQKTVNDIRAQTG